jgi:hypothetical protein
VYRKIEFCKKRKITILTELKYIHLGEILDLYNKLKGN